MTHKHGKKQNVMNYTAKDEEDFIKQIESDPELDKELEKENLVKGHVVEIRYTGKAYKKAGAARKNRLHCMRDALLIHDAILS